MVLEAHRHLHRIKRQQAALLELPLAQLTALTANVNRDPAKGKPFTAQDFLMFQEERPSDDRLRPEVAAVALALRNEDRLPRLLLTIWTELLEASKQDAKVPAVRALHSADEAVWVLAPRFERDGHVRGGLVAVNGRLHGPVTLRELDRPLMRHRLVLPERKGFGWLESDLLLLRAK